MLERNGAVVALVAGVVEHPALEVLRQLPQPVVPRARPDLLVDLVPKELAHTAGPILPDGLIEEIAIGRPQPRMVKGVDGRRQRRLQPVTTGDRIEILKA